MISVGNCSDYCGSVGMFVMRGDAKSQLEARESEDGIIFLPKLMVCADLMNSSKG